MRYYWYYTHVHMYNIYIYTYVQTQVLLDGYVQPPAPLPTCSLRVHLGGKAQFVDSLGGSINGASPKGLVYFIENHMKLLKIKIQ